MSANTLHTKKKVILQGGVVKMPFTLAAAIEPHGDWTPEDIVQALLEPKAQAMGKSVSKVKLCSRTFGWATFVPLS